MLINQINWEDEKPKLLNYLKSRLSYKQIGELYKMDPQEIREIIKTLGLIKNYYPDGKNSRFSIDELINVKLTWYTSGTLKHTRKYLIDRLREDICFRTHKGIMVKQDIIEQYLESRKDSKHVFNYDFSYLPEYITDRKEKFTIFVNEISPKTHKLVGFWETCFKHLVVKRMDHTVCGGIKAKDFCGMTSEEFINRCIKKFGNTYDYSKVEYVNMLTPVLIKCNKCGKYFWQVPSTHLESPGLGCPSCAMIDAGCRKYLDKEEFINRCDEIYGLIFDFTNSLYRGLRRCLTAINIVSGEEVTATAEEFLRGTIGKDKKSSGEKLIANWLDLNNIQYSYDSPIFDKIEGRRTRFVKIDFILNINNKEYWIEYNGVQHYKQIACWVTKSEFLLGVNRDNNVKEFCKNNGIIFVEIPYTYNTYNSVSEILYRVLINGETPDFINIPSVET